MKVSIIGAGNVGSSAAWVVCDKAIADEVVLVDITEGIPQGKALDIQEAMPLSRSNVKIKGTNNYSEIKDSDVVVVTAGVPRKPGMSRDDLLETNSNIIRSIAGEIKKNAPYSVVIVVTNPLDIMSYLMLKETGFDRKKVLGMAGVLDSTRFRTFIADMLETGVNDIEAMVLGGHGDSMVPLRKHTTVKGKPITDFLDDKDVEALIDRTRNGGAEIVKHLKTGSAFYAPGASIAEMIDAILKQDDRILPCSVMLQGEYGYKDIFLGVPCRLDSKGLKDIIELDLSDEEKNQLDDSAAAVKKNVDKLR
ncbi:malate dehydrogenase [Candidatus Woesearchaeota archaeon]|nr:malate dehydrogenase [Candidatus Woesearchaeota archaeon]